MSGSSKLRTIRVFLSSPGDVKEERKRAFQVIDQLNDDPDIKGQAVVEAVAWDKPGEYVLSSLAVHITDTIRKELHTPSECDLMIVILGSQMGTPLPEEYIKPAAFQYETGYTDLSPERYLSGTEWEFVNAIQSLTKVGFPITSIFRCEREPQISLSDPNRDWLLKQYDLVEAFFKSFNNPDGSIKWSYNPYKTLDEFENGLFRLLHSQIKRILLGTTKVLCTEEDPIRATLWRTLLGLIGFDCLIVDSFEETYRRLMARKALDHKVLILSAFSSNNLPMELAKSLREAGVRRPILFAGYSKSISFNEANEVFADIIVSPFSKYQNLKNKIQRLIGMEISDAMTKLNPKVLYIQDEPAIAEQLAPALELFNISTLSRIGNPEDAYEMIISGTPPMDSFDAFVLELRLPGLSGLELAKRLRQAGEKRPIWIVAQNKPSLNILSEFDFQHMGKPLDWSYIIDQINQLLIW